MIMARYQKPSDPRKEDQTRPRRQRRDAQEPVPWLWLGLGALVTVIAIVVAFLFARSFLLLPPLEAGALPQPTVIRLTAPPTPDATATAPFPTPTTIPTFTPVPTPDVAQPPEEVAVGYYAAVQGTGQFGLTLRGGPSANNVAVVVVPEGTLLFVFGGPEADATVDRLWWRVRLEDGQEGWVAGDFLAPAAAP